MQSFVRIICLWATACFCASGLASPVNTYGNAAGATLSDGAGDVLVDSPPAATPAVVAQPGTLSAPATPPLPPVHRIAAAIETELAAYRHRQDAEGLREAYAQRGFAPVWVRSGNAQARLGALRAVLNEARLDALNPRRYALPGEPDHLPGVDLARLARLDVLASRDLLRYVLDVNGAHPDSVAVDHPGAAKPEPVYPGLVLEGAANAPEVAAFIAGQRPANHVYANMRAALVRYHALAEAGGWPRVANGRRLEPGDTSTRVPTLRRRLFITGDLLDPDMESTRYDHRLVDAVVAFQTRHGLAPDGIVGPHTLTALNTSAERRLTQLAANMERARRLPADLGSRHVLVNVPGFELEVIDHGNVALSMPIIVGRRARSTPTYSSELTYLEFNPRWNVPESIARKDLLPKLQEDPYHMLETGLRLLDKATGQEISREEIDWDNVEYGDLPFRMRQDSGPRNALGRVKFLFQNPYAVYLHDTPSRRLFAKPVRAFSSGCIRLERPLEMAEYLLNGKPGWGMYEIERAVDAGRRLAVTLPEPVPVHLVYHTAWMGRDGRVQFRRDLYGHDAFLMDKLLAARRTDNRSDA